MGFKSLLIDQVAGAFEILGTDADGLAPKHTYVSVDLNASTYDPTTGRVTRSDTTHPDIPMVLAKFRINEMDQQIVVATDLKALIAAKNLAATPKVQDRIHLSDGRNFMVERVLGVPGDSLHILHIRRTE